MRSFSGGCVCGAIRYEVNGEPIVTFKCHCRDCQRVSGGAFSAVVYVPRESFRLTKGSLQHFATPSMLGGENKRGFCGECGSRLTGGETTEGIGILAGSMDDPSWFRPEMEIHVADAPPWDVMDPATQKFDGYPSA